MDRFIFDFDTVDCEFFILDTLRNMVLDTTKRRERAAYQAALYNAHPEALERREDAANCLYEMVVADRDHSEAAYEAEGELHSWVEDQFAAATAAWRAVHGETPGYYEYYGWDLAPLDYAFWPGMVAPPAAEYGRAACV